MRKKRLNHQTKKAILHVLGIIDVTWRDENMPQHAIMLERDIQKEFHLNLKRYTDKHATQLEHELIKLLNL